MYCWFLPYPVRLDSPINSKPDKSFDKSFIQDNRRFIIIEEIAVEKFDRAQSKKGDIDCGPESKFEYDRGAAKIPKERENSTVVNGSAKKVHE